MPPLRCSPALLFVVAVSFCHSFLPLSPLRPLVSPSPRFSLPLLHLWLGWLLGFAAFASLPILPAVAVSVAADLRIAVEADAHEAMTTAWSTEMAASNVSQGAYVSGQVHDLGMEARMGMQAQVGPVWPPRGSLADGGLPEQGACLPMSARVVSWTRLIAAGCPSEFAIRAPGLGGLTSMIVSFAEGPSGVFLHVDGHDNDVSINDAVQLVVRRVYAQDGVLRYGRKAIRA